VLTNHPVQLQQGGYQPISVSQAGDLAANLHKQCFTTSTRQPWMSIQWKPYFTFPAQTSCYRCIAHSRERNKCLSQKRWLWEMHKIVGFKRYSFVTLL
jgi:hypothetical protein